MAHVFILTQARLDLESLDGVRALRVSRGLHDSARHEAGALHQLKVRHARLDPARCGYTIDVGERQDVARRCSHTGVQRGAGTVAAVPYQPSARVWREVEVIRADNDDFIGARKRLALERLKR